MTRTGTDYIVGAFKDQQQETQAIEELRRAGFKDNCVEVADHSKDATADISVAQALKDRGFPEDEARFYQDEFRGGADLVTVKADGRRAEAEAILARHGRRAFKAATTVAPGAMPAARPVAPVAARPPETAIPPTTRPMPPVAATTPPPAPTPATPIGTATPNKTVQLKKEELEAHKEKVRTGDVVVKKEVHTEHQTKEVPVTKEEAYVERRSVPANEPASGPMRNEEIRIPITEERVEVEKRPVVKEEIVIGKRPVHETERVSGTVREEEAKIERHGEVDVKKT